MTTKILFQIEMCIKDIESLHKLYNFNFNVGNKINYIFLYINQHGKFNLVYINNCFIFMSVYFCYFHFKVHNTTSLFFLIIKCPILVC